MLACADVAIMPKPHRESVMSGVLETLRNHDEINYFSFDEKENGTYEIRLAIKTGIGSGFHLMVDTKELTKEVAAVMFVHDS